MRWYCWMVSVVWCWARKVIILCVLLLLAWQPYQNCRTEAIINFPMNSLSCTTDPSLSLSISNSLQTCWRLSSQQTRHSISVMAHSMFRQLVQVYLISNDPKLCPSALYRESQPITHTNIHISWCQQAHENISLSSRLSWFYPQYFHVRNAYRCLV